MLVFLGLKPALNRRGNDSYITLIPSLFLDVLTLARFILEELLLGLMLVGFAVE